jgi:hypothetical protein
MSENPFSNITGSTMIGQGKSAVLSAQDMNNDISGKALSLGR